MKGRNGADSSVHADEDVSAYSVVWLPVIGSCCVDAIAVLAEDIDVVGDLALVGVGRCRARPPAHSCVGVLIGDENPMDC